MENKNKTDDELKGKSRIPPMRQLLWIGGGVVAIVLSFIMGAAWSEDRSSFIFALGFVVMLPAGAFAIYKGLQKPVEGAVIVVGPREATKAVEGVEAPSLTRKANSLNIYATKESDDGKPFPQKVAFEYVEHPLGQPQQCTNDKQWYYVHLFDLATQKLKPLQLPDGQYFDPREFANVIVMPAHQKLFERQASMFQKVAPWVMVVAFLISVFGLIATSPPPGA